MPEDSTIDSNVDVSSENTSNNQTLSMLKNGINIERRVKKELIDQGLLDPDDFQKECEDEILTEIKKVRTELASIAEYNYEGKVILDRNENFSGKNAQAPYTDRKCCLIIAKHYK